ncbi:enterobactin exporter EntS [Streptomyces sp. ADI96-15]|uniref:MFS transporter n=1 Tax=Streptomyces TaxID=1883 RepID=UPI0003C3308C|nr:MULTISPECIES: MFS transporter [Streptomyces]ESQ03095.1 major facilitator superfamily protein [Streptomyces sp. PVA_94-07]RPK69647.1 enterobactin exporter EntS [Streptomyces sp. ADI96-15]RWZ77666.1 MFS transporter [Streptomyces albidoflavus]
MRLRQSLEPFKHRRFAYQYAGFTVSVVGNTLSQVAITVGVLQVTGSGALAGMALSASTVALVLCILFGGVWADRLPRHLVMATMDCVRATSQIGVGVMLLADSVSVPLLLLLQVCFGAAQAFHLPASSGLTRFTVPKDQLQRANTLLSFSRSMSGVLGPLLAGALIATVGAGWALIGDGLSFLVSAGCAVLIKLPPRETPREKDRTLRELAAGFRLVRTTPWIWTSIVGFMCTHVAVAVFMVVGPVLAVEDGSGIWQWSLLIAALGVGDVLGDLFLLRFQPQRPMLFARLAELLLVPMLLVIAWGAPLAVQIVVVALAGAGMTAADALWLTTMQHEVPENSLSKVASYDWLSSVALRPVGFALGAAFTGGGLAVVLTCLAVLVLASRLVSLAHPSVRALRTPADALAH